MGLVRLVHLVSVESPVSKESPVSEVSEVSEASEVSPMRQLHLHLAGQLQGSDSNQKLLVLEPQLALCLGGESKNPDSRLRCSVLRAQLSLHLLMIPPDPKLLRRLVAYEPLCTGHWPNCLQSYRRLLWYRSQSHASCHCAIALRIAGHQATGRHHDPV